LDVGEVDPPASEFYVPTFRNTLPVQLQGTEFSETSTHKINTPWESPKRKNTTSRTRRNFEIKNFA